MKGGIYFIRLENTEDKNSLLKWNPYEKKETRVPEMPNG